MTAPVATPRGSPTGIKLKDGYSAKITVASNATIEFFEKAVKPPGVDGGEPIPQTTMHNTTWRTFAPRALKTLTPSTCVAAYDPKCYTDILALINREDTITVAWADGSTLAFYGFLKSFIPNELKEGEQPEATVEFVPTNFDPTAHVEAGPTYTDAPGT